MLDTTFDKIVLIASASLLFSLFAVLSIKTPVQPQKTEKASVTVNNFIYIKEEVRIELQKTGLHKEEKYTLEEEPGEEFNCLFYATVPIGRYYITAYNHKETGSKMTASGKTVHEGTITTCAADPKYHKFGQYLEIGGRIYVVEDTGSAVKKKHIDLYFADYKAMAKYGSHYENIYRVEFPFGKPGQD